MLATAKEMPMTLWKRCSCEDALWKLRRLEEFHGLTLEQVFHYANEKSGRNGSNPGSDYIHFWMKLVDRDAECPDYFDTEYMKLPMKVRNLATAG